MYVMFLGQLFSYFMNYHTRVSYFAKCYKIRRHIKFPMIKDYHVFKNSQLLFLLSGTDNKNWLLDIYLWMNFINFYCIKFSS